MLGWLAVRARKLLRPLMTKMDRANAIYFATSEQRKNYIVESNRRQSETRNLYFIGVYFTEPVVKIQDRWDERY